MSASPIDLHWVQRPGTRVRNLYRPATLADAAELKAADPTRRLIAGGTDLLLELARDERAGMVDLIDLTAIEGFRRIMFDDPEHREHVVLGAGVTHADVLAAEELAHVLLPLAQACLEVGSPQLRNRATIAGNVVTASPANDTITALYALGASVRIVRKGTRGLDRRTVAIEDFITGFRQTELAEDDLVQSIVVPKLRIDQRGVWVKAGLRRAQAISVVHAGLVVSFGDDDVVAGARIALGSVGPTVEFNDAAQLALIGRQLTPEVVAEAAAAAASSIEPIDDGRATAAYRRDSVRTVVGRALAALAAGREADRWPRYVPRLSTAGPDDALSTPTDVSAGAEIAVTVNGYQVRAPAGSGTLLDWLRDHVGPGTKEGCAEGECGACTVQLDGDAVMSCLVASGQADRSAVTTVEGLGSATDPTELQQQFVDRFAVQCGYCIPGFIVAAETLAGELDRPATRDEIEFALAGNLCRCTGYYNIIDAVSAAMASGGDRR